MSPEKSSAVAEPTTAFVDTNLLIRYFAQDDPAHTQAVHRLLERAARGEVSLVVAPVVLAEIAWVLESHFSLSLETIADYLEGRVRVRGVSLPGSGSAGGALRVPLAGPQYLRIRAQPAT